MTHQSANVPTDGDRETNGSHQLARIVTEVLAPAPVVATVLLVVAAHSGKTILEGLAWGLLAVAITIPVPLVYILLGVRERRLSDRHVRERMQRPLPMLIAIATVVAALIVLPLLGAPRELTALIGAMVVGLAVSLLITLAWKISIHTAVVAGAVAILALTFGGAYLMLVPFVGLVGWARVRLGDHDPWQVGAGAALGAVIAAVVFTFLR